MFGLSFLLFYLSMCWRYCGRSWSFNLSHIACQIGIYSSLYWGPFSLIVEWYRFVFRFCLSQKHCLFSILFKMSSYYGRLLYYKISENFSIIPIIELDLDILIVNLYFEFHTNLCNLCQEMNWGTTNYWNLEVQGT